MESDLKRNELMELLKWQLELGVTETIGEVPLNRFQTPEQEIDRQPKASSQDKDNINLDACAIAFSVANSSKSLKDLFNALESFEHCDLKQGAKKLVFSDGDTKSKLMVIGEAPGREEDKTGKPFVGPAGQLLDKMFQAIGFKRFSENNSMYITNVIDMI